MGGGRKIDTALGEFLGRLGTLLTVLDDKLQTEGLFPDEEAVRLWVQNLIDLDNVYKKHFDSSLWEGLGEQAVDDIASQLLRTRERLHSIEGERFVLSALMREVGRLDRVAKLLCEASEVEWPEQYDYMNGDNGANV